MTCDSGYLGASELLAQEATEVGTSTVAHTLDITHTQASLGHHGLHQVPGQAGYHPTHRHTVHKYSDTDTTSYSGKVSVVYFPTTCSVIRVFFLILVEFPPPVVI